MKTKKIKANIVIVLLNIVLIVGSFFTITSIEANIWKGWIIDDINNIYIYAKDHKDKYQGIFSMHEAYIDGKLNDEYKAELIATYTRLATDYTSDGYSKCYGVAYDEEGNIIGQSGNSVILELFERDENDNPVYKYRILDVDKLIDENTLKGINEFIENNGYICDLYDIALVGKMDSLYFYPEIIIDSLALHSGNRFEDMMNANIHLGDEYYRYRYIIKQDYDYYNEEVIENAFWYEEFRGININGYISLELTDSHWHIHGENIFMDYANNKNYNEAIENVAKAIENVAKDGKLVNGDITGKLVYSKDSIFDFERIYARELTVSGHTIREYISFSDTPFLHAIGECTFRYIQALIVIGIINLVLLVLRKLYLLRSEEYGVYAKKVFTEVTSKLTGPLENIKKMHDSIDSKKMSDEDAIKTREMIDKEISLMISNITDILNLSKMEAGILNMEVDEIELGYLVQAIVDKKKANIKSCFECDIDEELIINGDLNKLAKCITVLVESVIKRTDNIETIYVEVKKQDDKAYFEVANRKKSSFSLGLTDSVSKDLFSTKNMKRDGYDLILVKGFLNLHNADYGWSNDEENVRYWFKMPVDLKLDDTKKQKKNDIKKIYGVVAHEIKTPLNVIRLHNEALKEDILNEEEAKRYKAIISNQIDIIKTQLEQVISTNELEDGSLKMERQNIDMIKVVKEAIANYKLLIEDKKIHIEMDMPETLMIKADKCGLHSIVSNYIVNSIKYSKVSGNIKISVKDDKNCVIFKTVNSDAVQMNSSLNDIIDDKAAKAENKKMINRIEKDGLGLLIAKSYIKLHKASFGNEINNDTVEYWVKFTKKNI